MKLTKEDKEKIIYIVLVIIVIIIITPIVYSLANESGYKQINTNCISFHWEQQFGNIVNFEYNATYNINIYKSNQTVIVCKI